jgi:hypothetical protein
MSRFDRPPEIDYLAKDFASFRQLMLDQIALLIPDWQERHPADLGNMLVDILAYAADYLSYYQDAVATEAYLGTARLRRSVRRHARLLDYDLHNGCNARTWVHIALEQHVSHCYLPKGTVLLAGVSSSEHDCVLSSQRAALLSQENSVQVFTTMHDADLSALHQEIPFHVQGREDAILPRGAVSARLRDSWLHKAADKRALDGLAVGDVLILEQRLDPASGLSAGVDPSHRHAVRLTQVERLLLEPAPAHHNTAAAVTPVVRIAWDLADALPFDLPVGPFRSTSAAAEVSVALGNVVLVDHGAWVGPETLPPIATGDRYRPLLLSRDITYATAYDHTQARKQPARATLRQRPNEAQAVVELTEVQTTQLAETGGHPPLMRRTQSASGATQFETVHRWVQRRDLLSSDRTGRNFVVETEDDGRATLRFGFGGLGKEPAPDSTLIASYRTGNGSQANVGRHAIAHIVSDSDELSHKIVRVRNPLPVTSGIDLEPIDTARLAAPYAFQNHLSCIHPDDYVRLAQQFPGGDVLRAAAQIERTGNWQTVFVYAQRTGGRLADLAFRQQLLAWLQPLAMSGYQVAVRSPYYVDLELHLRVRVMPGRFSSAVQQAVKTALGSGVLEDGSPAIFNPDTLAFGQSLYRSQIIRAAMAVDGVAQVEIVSFRRLDDSRSSDPLPIGKLEIARLNTDPGRPERGRLRIDLEGGA